MTYYYSSELNHHGILGQKWGKRNGPPYPLDAEDHSRSEKKEGWRKSLGKGRNEELYGRKNKNSEEDKKQVSKLDRHLMKTYGLDEDQIAKYKKTAAVLGVSLAATAGVLAVAYTVNKNSNLGTDTNVGVSGFLNRFKDRITGGKDFVRMHVTNGYDAKAFYGTSRTTSVDAINNTFLVGDPVGGKALLHGYDTVSDGKELLEWASPVKDIQALAKDCIVNQRDPQASVMERRLSCWSGSHSYLLSRLTGKQYCSRNYQNLVEFNSFGSLYNKPMEIVDLFGKKASNFVGDWGKTKGTKISGEEDVTKMVSTIFNNFSKPNTKDGSIVGFIDAAYRSTTCTHQWNFEIDDLGALSMIDTWSGEKYDVARKRKSDGQIQLISDGASKLLSEMYHYNRESFRMYSPSLEDLNLDMMAEIVLARKLD